MIDEEREGNDLEPGLREEGDQRRIGGEKPLFFILRTFYFVLEYSRLTMLR